MCWSAEASVAMVAAGAIATGVTFKRDLPSAIWGTLGYFTLMEALQVAGYAVVDRCGTPENRAVTLASYLHIVFQPIVINLFALELVPETVKKQARGWAVGLAATASAVMLLQLAPIEALGTCSPGTPLCAPSLCTVSGDWHIAWNVPYNGLFVPFEQALGFRSGFPAYMLAVFVLPLFYAAWRFVLMHALAGPVLAWSLTSNPNEMPAVWCLFSVVILAIGLSPAVRRHASSRTWWGVEV